MSLDISDADVVICYSVVEMLCRGVCKWISIFKKVMTSLIIVDVGDGVSYGTVGVRKH